MNKLLFPLLLASVNSDYQAEVLLAGASRNFSPSRAILHQDVKEATFQITANATIADGEFMNLGSLGIPGATILPDECSIRGTGTTNINAKFTLEKTNADGTNAVALTAQTAQITSPTAKNAFAIPTAGADLIELAHDDFLRIKCNFGTGTTITFAASNTFEVIVRYRLKDPV